jgi:hypothetical protein
LVQTVNSFEGGIGFECGLIFMSARSISVELLDNEVELPDNELVI